MPQAVVSNHNARMLCLGEKVRVYKVETHEASTTPHSKPNSSDTSLWPQQPFQSSDYLSSSSEQGFLIAVLNPLSFYFHLCSFYLCSIYLSQHLCWADKQNVGTSANCMSLLTLSPPLYSLYIKVVELFPSHSPPLFVLSGYGIILYTTFYYLFTFILSPVHVHLLTWFCYLIYNPFIWKLSMNIVKRKDH